MPEAAVTGERKGRTEVIQPPRKRDSLLLFLVAVILGALAHSMGGWHEWLRLSLVGSMLVFAYFGLVSHIDWAHHTGSKRIEERDKARVAGTTGLALALNGLPLKAIEYMNRNDLIKIGSYLRKDGVWKVIHAPGGDIPEEFMYDFLVKSTETEPYLWPVREHDVFAPKWGREGEKQNPEELCKLATDCLTHNPVNLAYKAAGNHSAMARVSLDVIAAYFGLEL